MKRLAVLAAVVAVGCFGYWAANAQQAATEPAPAEKKVTLTKSQFEKFVQDRIDKEVEDLVQKRIAQQMLDEEVALHERVLQGDNWHTAVYSGVEYTIYTGPGQVLATRWAPAAQGAAPPAEKPDDAAAVPEVKEE